MPRVSYNTQLILALRIRQHVRAHPLRWNARQLAPELRVSEKNVRHALALLRDTYGVRVIYDRERHGLSAPSMESWRERFMDDCQERLCPEN